MSPLSNIYPFVAHPTVILNDDDLIEHVRKTAGDGIAELLTMRLEIARPRPKLDAKIKQAWESICDAHRDIERVLDLLDEED